ncbi:fused DSP-PTPase phosphatase/NAD kinase-like protein [Pseudohongiella nitratireducens]|uniref:phosphatase domain-containing putative toxin n=1 Tax=Pseudohongiella nitratireducens TaxID=1768907 RepID=UPI0030EE9377|tara:strand:+ start:3226 stop:3762 length:537 start_codon:yes stop_codon:yes gene_type:complete
MMKGYRLLRSFLAALLITSVLPLVHADDALTYRDVVKTQIENLSQPAPSRFSSAQPSQQQLAELAAAGVKHIISLRPASELEWNEREVVESLGMTFHNVPVAVPDGINLESAEEFSRVLESIGGEPVLMHCASGNRVGAMVALKHGADTGDLDTAVTLGKAWGMTRLESMVREKLTTE